MALLYSTQIKMGSRMPSFSLPSVEGINYSEKQFADKRVLVILFICNHCPYVKAVMDRILALQRLFKHQSVQFVGICSNDPTDYPEDAPAELEKQWRLEQYGFPYLVDLEQTVARAFQAVCTPDIFVYDSNRLLAYHGRIDDNWQDESQVSSQDLRDAINAILGDHPVSLTQQPSMGCSIKWRKSS